MLTVGAYSLVALACVVCTRLDCWDFAIGFGLIAVALLFKREGRRAYRRWRPSGPVQPS